MVLSCGVFGQNISPQERDAILQDINNLVNQAQTNIDDSYYFEAQKNLENALESSILIDDKKSLGIIYSKLGKIKYIIEEPNEALKYLDKAQSFQRAINDKINLAESYKTRGNVYVLKKQYKQSSKKIRL